MWSGGQRPDSHVAEAGGLSPEGGYSSSILSLARTGGPRMQGQGAQEARAEGEVIGETTWGLLVMRVAADARPSVGHLPHRSQGTGSCWQDGCLDVLPPPCPGTCLPHGSSLVHFHEAQGDATGSAFPLWPEHGCPRPTVPVLEYQRVWMEQRVRKTEHFNAGTAPPCGSSVSPFTSFFVKRRHLFPQSDDSFGFERFQPLLLCS